MGSDRRFRPLRKEQCGTGTVCARLGLGIPDGDGFEDGNLRFARRRDTCSIGDGDLESFVARLAPLAFADFLLGDPSVRAFPEASHV